MPTRARFPRSARLTAASDFDAAFKSGQRNSDPLLSLHWRQSGEAARLGLAVSRKVDRRAVVRNRIKRALRQRFRMLRSELAGGDYVLVARVAAAKTPPQALADALQSLLHRAGAWPAAPMQSTAGPVPGTMRSAAVAQAGSKPVDSNLADTTPDVPAHNPMPASDAG